MNNATVATNGGSAATISRARADVVCRLLREVNTIGSKANDAEIAREVVTIKAELERFREQVQNIE